MSLHLLGAEQPGQAAAQAAGGFSWGGIVGPILQFAGEAGKTGISMWEQNETQNRLAAEEQSKLTAALDADRKATAAIARADVAVKLNMPTKAADQGAAEVAERAQDRAGAALSPAASAKRVTVAEDALEKAAAASQSDPKSAYKAALVRAWTKTANKANGITLVTSDSGRNISAGTARGGSWFTRPVVGPVPGWGVAVGGVGLLTGLGLFLRRVL